MLCCRSRTDRCLRAAATVELAGYPIAQRINPMHSPYEGNNSLPGSGEHALTHSYVASFGTALHPGMHAYLDLRLQRGTAVNDGDRLAGFVNGDFASGAAQSAPYVYRAYLRYCLAQGNERKQIDKRLAMGAEPRLQPRQRARGHGCLRRAAGFFLLSDSVTCLTKFVHRDVRAR
jgi:hypothetical protein